MAANNMNLRFCDFCEDLFGPEEEMEVVPVPSPYDEGFSRLCSRCKREQELAVKNTEWPKEGF